MAKVYDITDILMAKNEKPVIKISGRLFTVDTSTGAMFKIACIQDEAAKSSDKVAQFKALDKIVTTALGEKGAEYISTLHLTMDAYGYLVETIIAAMEGASVDKVQEVEKGAVKN